MNQKEEKPAVMLVDPFAADRGHLLDDDLFLSECIAPLAGEFVLTTSPTSVANAVKHLSVDAREIEPFISEARFPRLRLFRILLSLRCSRYRHVVFQSFEEVSVLFFLFLHPFKRVHLIVTNNLRADRLKRHPLLGRFFLGAVFRHAESVIVHCRHEAEKVRELAPGLDPAKIFIKPFHQLAVSRNRLAWEETSRTILFLGPELEHKKIAPVVDLIKADRENRYRYVFCSMRDVAPETRAFLEARDNVELLTGYVADDEYYRLFSEADFVIMTHDEDFEGALSGAFCDAVASGTAVVARDMAPHDEFFERFGPMGFLVNFTGPEWCKRVLAGDMKAEYKKFRANMAACRESCGMEAVRDVFRRAFAPR